MNILILDDEPSVLKALSFILSRNGHITTEISSPKDIDKIIYNKKIDLVISDFDFGPSTIIQHIKSVKKIPLIIVSGKATKPDIIDLINNGVFYFIEKPIEGKKLLNAIEKANTKFSIMKNNILNFLNIEIDFERNIYFNGNKEIILTPKEMKLLTYFFNNLNIASNREDLEALINDGVSVSKHCLNTHICNLKNKIPILNKHIKSLYGKGFILKIDFNG